MAQELITMNSIVIAQPDEGLGYNFETTYSEDTGRVITGEAKLTALFTVEALSFNFSSLTLAEANTIARIIMNGNRFSLRYPSLYYGAWRTDTFYVGKGGVNWGRLNVDEELLEEFAFNAVGVNPL